MEATENPNLPSVIPQCEEDHQKFPQDKNNPAEENPKIVIPTVHSLGEVLQEFYKTVPDEDLCRPQSLKEELKREETKAENSQSKRTSSAVGEKIFLKKAMWVIAIVAMSFVIFFSGWMIYPYLYPVIPQKTQSQTQTMTQTSQPTASKVELVRGRIIEITKGFQYSIEITKMIIYKDVDHEFIFLAIEAKTSDVGLSVGDCISVNKYDRIYTCYEEKIIREGGYSKVINGSVDYQFIEEYTIIPKSNPESVNTIPPDKAKKDIKKPVTKEIGETSPL